MGKFYMAMEFEMMNIIENKLKYLVVMATSTDWIINSSLIAYTDSDCINSPRTTRK